MTSDAVSAERRLRPSTPPFQPAADVLSGETADVYFERTRRILATEGLDPVVTMEIFCRADAILCGAEEAIAYLREILGNGKRLDPVPVGARPASRAPAGVEAPMQPPTTLA